MKFVLSPPLFGFIVSTRGALGVGVGLLLAGLMTNDRRRRLGLTLLAFGAATTVPAVRGVLESRQKEYPRLADGTLVAAQGVSFPSIPSVASPRAIPPGRQTGKPLPLLVPQVDADGNERAGIRLPDVAVPLATYTGWNFRNPSTGAPGDLVSLLGASIPFPITAAARAAAKDPRRSIEERYPTRDGYIEQVRAAADALVRKGYLLVDDVERIVQRSTDNWDNIVGSRP